jgi:hypothetical protein
MSFPERKVHPERVRTLLSGILAPSLQNQRNSAHQRAITANMAKTTQTSIPAPFLVILLFWLTLTFASFGLFAPENAVVIWILFLCAVSIGGAVFLILELDTPFDGLIRVSADPLRYAIAHLNQ